MEERSHKAQKKSRNNTFSLTLTFPAAPRPDGKIVGGFPINITAVPWQVALLYNGGQRCGGSIVSKEWIVTAAHCLEGINPRRYTVLVGTTDKLSGGQRLQVADYAIHRQYGSLDYDFGLLKLAEELTFDETVQAVALPEIDAADLENGQSTLISGWGNTQNSSESSRYLRAVEVPIVDQELCNKAYSGRITPRMFCAGLYEQGGKDGKKIA